MNVRKAFRALVMVFIACSIVGIYLLYHSDRKLALAESERDVAETVEALKEGLISLIGFNRDAVSAMSKFDALQDALISPTLSSLERANHVLDNFAQGMGLDMGYLIDSSGVCIASSNRYQSNNLVGTDYSFRRYVQEAMTGTISVELALGFRTDVRGLFVSAPVFRTGSENVIGVVVMKVSIESLERMFRSSRDMVSSLVHDTGMIFISSKKEWSLKLLWKPSPELITGFQESQQFGKGPWHWTGLDFENDNQTANFQGQRYSLRSASLTNCPGWKIVILYDLDAMTRRTMWSVLGLSGYAATFLLLVLGGAIVCLYILGNRDIERRRLAEKALEESEERFRALFERHDAVMLLVNPENGSIENANDAAAAYYGYTREALCKMNIGEINCLSREELFDEMSVARAEHRNYFLFPHRLSNGEIRHVEVHSSPVDVNGRTLLFSIIHDITQRKEAEESLVHKTALLNGLLNSIPDIVFFKDREGVYLGCNSEFAKLVGIDKELVEGKTDYDLFATEQANFFREHDESVVQAGTGRHNEEWVDYPDGSRIVVDTFKAPLRSDEGRAIGIVGVSRDVTEKRAAERKLKELNETLEQKVLERSAELSGANQKLLEEIEDHKKTADQLTNSEATLRLIIETAPMGVYVIQEEKYSFVNDSFLEIFGLNDRSDAVGQPITMACEASWRDLLQELSLQHLQKGNSCRVNEINLVTHDKRSAFLNVSMEMTELWGNQAIVGFVTDVTTEKELRAHLNRSQRMESLGTLAGGIAHDFNNILFAILGFADLALDDAPDESPLRGRLERILKAVDRASKLVAHILAFSREVDQERAPVQISPIIKESLNFLRSTISANIEIRTNITPHLHSVFADATQIHQIIMNLATNAAHAMKNSGGVLTVNLDELLLSEDFTLTRPELIPGTYQRLMVSDTGHGMNSETLERIFDPYFTTKERGEGTGLGLSIIHEIIKGYGGSITAESSPGIGTTFEIYLPIVDEAETCEATDSSLPEGVARILLVDDEEIIRDSAGTILERLGYQVTTEDNPLNALTRIENSPRSFDLVITDLSMPGMTGLQLASNIYNLRPDLPIILVTGYADSIEEDNLSDFGIRDLLYKPVRKYMLAQCIHRVLVKTNSDSLPTGKGSCQ